MDTQMDNTPNHLRPWCTVDEEELRLLRQLHNIILSRHIIQQEDVWAILDALAPFRRGDRR